MKTILLKWLYSIILLATNKPTLSERLYYLFKSLVAFAPIAYAMDRMGWWFENNAVFYRGLLFAIALNMYYGWRYHKRAKDFKHRIFWMKNIEMWAIIISIYPLLEILYVLAGENIIGETFKIAVQISTILYPGSKALKSAYLFSEKKYPPGFIMDRLYNFEKSGDLRDLYDKTETDKLNNTE